jgi:hypothetical protein
MRIRQTIRRKVSKHHGVKDPFECANFLAQSSMPGDTGLINGIHATIGVSSSLVGMFKAN